MSIHELIEDARYLYDAQRDESALLLTLIAIEVRGKQRFPSMKENGERFKNCMREMMKLYTPFKGGSIHIRMGKMRRPMPEMLQLTFIDPPEFDGLSSKEYIEKERKYEELYKKELEALHHVRDEHNRQLDEWAAEHKDQLKSIEWIFWTICRCSICHEGGVDSTKLRFIEDEKLVMNNEEDVLHLSRAWILYLLNMVEADLRASAN